MDYRATWSMTAIKRSRRVTASKYVTSNPGGPIKGLKATATQGRVVDTQYNTLLCGKFFGTYGTPSQYGIGKSSKSRNEASVKQLIMNPIKQAIFVHILFTGIGKLCSQIAFNILALIIPILL